MCLIPSKLKLFCQQNQDFQTQLVTPYPETQDSLTGLYQSVLLHSEVLGDRKYNFFSSGTKPYQARSSLLFSLEQEYPESLWEGTQQECYLNFSFQDPELQ